MLKQNKFIVIDGTDGSGKATQTKMLVDRLKKEKFPIETISFPQYGEQSAGPTENYLSGKYGSAEEIGPYRASTFYAIDRYDASFKINKWLFDGKIIVADRYVSSNMAHQGGKIKNDNERKKFFDWVYDFEFNIFKIPKPDLNIILHVNPEISQKLKLEQKKESGPDIHEKDLNHLKQAEEVYLELVKKYPKDFSLIECVKNGQIMTREEIHKILYEKIKKII